MRYNETMFGIGDFIGNVAGWFGEKLGDVAGFIFTLPFKIITGAIGLVGSLLGAAWNGTTFAVGKTFDTIGGAIQGGLKGLFGGNQPQQQQPPQPRTAASTAPAQASQENGQTVPEGATVTPSPLPNNPEQQQAQQRQ